MCGTCPKIDLFSKERHLCERQCFHGECSEDNHNKIDLHKCIDKKMEEFKDH